MNNVVSFAGRLRDARTAAGLTRKELAVKAGISWQAIRAWEQGTREPGLSRILSLAVALDIGVARLMGFYNAKERGSC